MVSSLGQGENDIRKSASFDKCIWRGTSFVILGKVMGTLVKALHLGFFGLISHGIMHWQELLPLYKLKAKPQSSALCLDKGDLPNSQWCLIDVTTEEPSRMSGWGCLRTREPCRMSVWGCFSETGPRFGSLFFETSCSNLEWEIALREVLPICTLHIAWGCSLVVTNQTWVDLEHPRSNNKMACTLYLGWSAVLQWMSLLEVKSIFLFLQSEILL
jgi:hypothetical protein